MDVEMMAIKKNKTWHLVEPPKNKLVVECKWVYKIMEKLYDSIEKFNARLVAKGYTLGIDYEESFSPVAKMITIRIVIAITTHFEWKVAQLDVKSAFLNGELNEEVYMEQPPSYANKRREHLVCKFKKALHGLKRAPQAWYTKLDSHLKQNRFSWCKSNPSLYTKIKNGLTTIIVVYVDDMIVTGDDQETIKWIKSQIENEFKMIDMGQLHYYFGIEVSQKDNSILIPQLKYAKNLLKGFNMEDCNAILTLMERQDVF